MGRVRAVAGAILAAAVVAAGAAAASAHAVLVRSTPSAGASVAEAPAAVVLEFSDPVAAGLSTATVTDASGAVVSAASRLSEDRRTLTVALRPLEEGVYAVRWRVLSTADGHATTGFFLFAVGRTLPPQAARGTSAAAPPPPRVAIRFVAFAAAIFLAGLAAFRVVVLRPTHRGPGAPQPPDASGLLRRAEVAAASVLAAAVVGEFALQTSALVDGSVVAAWRTGLLWMMLGGTKAGWGALVRLAGAAVLLIPPTPSGRILRAAALLWCGIVGGLTALFGGPTALAGSTHLPLVLLVATVYGLVGVAAAVVIPLIPGIRVPPLSGTGPVATGVILAGITLNSHAAALGPAEAAVDWIHLAAAGTWVGGLATLGLILWRTPAADRASVGAALVPRFSQVAALSLGVLVVTGVYSALVHIPTVRALTQTPYGRALAVKMALVLPAVALGAYHRVVVRPRLRPGPEGGRVARRFARTLAGEVVLGAAIVMVVAALTITPPASVAPSAQPPPVLLTGLAGEFRVELEVAPARLGWNRLQVVVRGRQGPLDPESSRVLVRAVKMDEDLGPLTIVLRPVGDRFVAEGSELGLAGVWELHVVVRRRGQRDEVATFPLAIEPLPARQPDSRAVRLLQQAAQAASRVRTWREREQIADGAGGVAVTVLDLARPDRLRYRTAGGTEAVIIGATRYFRTAGGPWDTDTLPSPVVLQGPFATYLAEPQGAVLGPQGRCGDESCQAVAWRSPGGTAVLAAWVGARTFRIHRLLMVAPAHYMTTEAFDFDAPLRIAPP